MLSVGINVCKVPIAGMALGPKGAHFQGGLLIDLFANNRAATLWP
jgi:hypothetical protein